MARKEVEFTVRFIFDDSRPLPPQDQRAFKEIMRMAKKLNRRPAPTQAALPPPAAERTGPLPPSVTVNEQGQYVGATYRRRLCRCGQVLGNAVGFRNHATVGRCQYALEDLEAERVATAALTATGSSSLRDGVSRGAPPAPGALPVDSQPPQRRRFECGCGRPITGVGPMGRHRTVCAEAARGNVRLLEAIPEAEVVATTTTPVVASEGEPCSTTGADR